MPLVATVLLAFCALAGAALDVVSRRLPNWLCLLTAIAGLALALVNGGAAELGTHLGHGAIALLAGMLLFRLGWIGGGDAKFYAACACWFPLTKALSLLGLVSVSGLAVLVVWSSGRLLRPALAGPRQGHFAMVPFGVSVAIGAVALKVLQG